MLGAAGHFQVRVFPGLSFSPDLLAAFVRGLLGLGELVPFERGRLFHHVLFFLSSNS